MSMFCCIWRRIIIDNWIGHTFHYSEMSFPISFINDNQKCMYNRDRHLLYPKYKEIILKRGDLLLPPPLKLPWYSWNIAKSGAKNQKSYNVLWYRCIRSIKFYTVFMSCPLYVYVLLPFLWFTKPGANPRRVGDMLVWAVRSNDLTHQATRTPQHKYYIHLYRQKWHKWRCPFVQANFIPVFCKIYCESCSYFRLFSTLVIWKHRYYICSCYYGNIGITFVVVTLIMVDQILSTK
jgi:hypothetical protein